MEEEEEEAGVDVEVEGGVVEVVILHTKAQRRNADYGCSDNRLLYLHTIDPATCMKRGKEVKRSRGVNKYLRTL